MASAKTANSCILQREKSFTALPCRVVKTSGKWWEASAALELASFPPYDFLKGVGWVKTSFSEFVTHHFFVRILMTYRSNYFAR